MTGRPIFWTEERIDQVRKLADEGKTVSEIAQALCRSGDQVRWHACKNDIAIGGAYMRFTEREDNIIRMDAHLGWVAVARKLGRNVDSVGDRAARLGVKTGNNKTWPDAEIQMLRDLAKEGLACWQIAQRMNRTMASIRGQAKRQKIRMKRAKKLPVIVKKPKPAEQKYKRRTCLVGGETFDARVDANGRFLEYSCLDHRNQATRYDAGAMI